MLVDDRSRDLNPPCSYHFHPLGSYQYREGLRCGVGAGGGYQIELRRWENGGDGV